MPMQAAAPTNVAPTHRRLAAVASHVMAPGHTAAPGMIPAPVSAQPLGPVLGFVSDERYLAVPGMHCEFVAVADGQRYVVDSTASGAVCAPLPPGEYGVALNLAGYGAYAPWRKGRGGEAGCRLAG